MILAFDLRDLPGDAIFVLVALLLGFFQWLKGRFGRREEEEEVLTEEEERMREIVWRRQMGDEDARAPWETDPTVWHPDTAQPPPLPDPPRATPEPPRFQPPALPELSEKEKRLAEAFERGTTPRRAPSRSRTPLGRALRASGGARQAILLAEVLGPPVALRGPGERHP